MILSDCHRETDFDGILRNRKSTAGLPVGKCPQALQKNA